MRSHSTLALAVAVERSTRLVTAQIVSSLKPLPFAMSIAGQLKNKQVITLTTDNGIENKQHQQTDVVHALTRINNKPRKILGYKSSLQLAKEKGLILEGCPD